MDSIFVKYEADLSKLRADFAALEKEIRRPQDAANKSSKGVSDSFNKAGKSINNATKEVSGFDKTIQKATQTLIAFAAVDRILQLGKAIIDTTAKFERFEAVLTNTLGSKSEAQKALNMIKEFAASTPFQVDELTESYVKLANQGFRPTADQMRRLGDLAASTGKNFNQLTEAIIDAQTGEFERLKEFGIRASKEGDKVSFAFKGVSTQVDFTNDSIRNYILSLGDLEGVSGAMAAISETVGGKISNLGDAFDSLFNSLGSAQSGIIKDTIEGLSKLVHGLEIALLTQEQIEERIAAKRNQVQTNQVFGFIEEDIKKLAQVSESEDEARDIVLRANIIEFEKSIKENTILLEKQKRLFGELRSTEQDNILKELQDQITFDQSIVKEITTRLEDVEKAKKAQEEADKKRREAEKKEEEKRQKERQEELKQRLDDLKKHLTEKENIEKQHFVDREIDEKELNKRLENLDKQFKQDEINLLKKFGGSTVDVEKQILDKQVSQRKEAEKEKLDAIRKTYDAEASFAKMQAEKGKKSAEEASKRNQAEADGKKAIRQDREKAVMNFAIEAANQVAGLVAEIEQRKTDEALKQSEERTNNEIAALEKRREQGQISENLFQQRKEAILLAGKQREAAIKTKDAQNDKKLALFRIAIDTAAAVIKGIVQFGPPPSPAGITAIASALALGLLEGGIVAATPIPKFAKGVTRFKGKGTNTSDSNLAWLSNNESVVNAKASIENEKAIDSLNRGDFKKYIEKNHVLPALKKASEAKHREEMNFANNINNMYNLMKNKDGFYDGNIVKAIRKNSNVSLNDNSLERLGKIITKNKSEDRY